MWNILKNTTQPNFPNLWKWDHRVGWVLKSTGIGLRTVVTCWICRRRNVRLRKEGCTWGCLDSRGWTASSLSWNNKLTSCSCLVRSLRDVVSSLQCDDFVSESGRAAVEIGVSNLEAGFPAGLQAHDQGYGLEWGWQACRKTKIWQAWGLGWRQELGRISRISLYLLWGDTEEMSDSWTDQEPAPKH